jgi:response regulator NasT
LIKERIQEMDRLTDDRFCAESDKGESENSLETLRILIVEDDTGIRQMIRALVVDLGHTVVGETSSGKEAVEMTCALRPDIVLMDLELFHIDGLEATRRIQECYPTPVVALSAYAMPELPKWAKEAGASAYLAKPFTPCDLERVIALVIACFEDGVDAESSDDGLLRGDRP